MSTQPADASTGGVSTARPVPDADGARGDDRLDRDLLFHLLANRRRRAVLYYLAEHDSRVSMRTLAERIAAWEHGTTVRQLGSDQRQRVYIALYQSHLPKLDGAGVIAYDQARGIVERADRADQLDGYVLDNPYESTDSRTDEPTGDEDDERPNRSSPALAVAVGSLGVLAASWFGIVPASALLAITWVGICLGFVLGADDLAAFLSSGADR
ncbi:MAG: hypothetical protein QXG03_02200 [Halalkalicoccus sp.]